MVRWILLVLALLATACSGASEDPTVAGAPDDPAPTATPAFDPEELESVPEVGSAAVDPPSERPLRNIRSDEVEYVLSNEPDCLAVVAVVADQPMERSGCGQDDEISQYFFCRVEFEPDADSDMTDGNCSEGDRMFYTRFTRPVLLCIPGFEVTALDIKVLDAGEPYLKGWETFPIVLDPDGSPYLDYAGESFDRDLEQCRVAHGLVAPTPTPEPPATPTPVPPPAAVLTGAQVLADDGFALLAGQRVGLLANHTSTAVEATGVERPLPELLAEHPDVQLTALFAPEHGVFGDEDAGVVVGDTALAGVPVYSLFDVNTQRFKPTPEMLTDVDVLVYDIQDVGVRTYTFISTMGLAMQAAAENGKAFVVLDQINPQGGENVEGFIRTPDQDSFIGKFPIPLNYGLTVGELAQAIKGEAWLPGLSDLDLTVVELQGWTPDLVWLETEQDWVPPSPGLPRVISALAYPGTVLFEATSLSFGKGTPSPFTTLGAPWVDSFALAEELNSRGLTAGFEPTSFIPRSSEIAPTPKFEGEQLEGVDMVVGLGFEYRAVETAIHMLEVLQAQANAAQVTLIDRPDTFDLLAGTTQLRTMLESGAAAEEIIAAWQDEVTTWDAAMDAYRLY